jgi:hypothetical protein
MVGGKMTTRLTMFSAIHEAGRLFNMVIQIFPVVGNVHVTTVVREPIVRVETRSSYGTMDIQVVFPNGKKQVFAIPNEHEPILKRLLYIEKILLQLIEEMKIPSDAWFHVC